MQYQTIDELREKHGLIMDDNPLLREVSDPVTKFDNSLISLVGKMFDAMRELRGRGISAIQIGVKKRVIIITNDRGEAFVLTNPVFLRRGNRFVTEPEGCLSIAPSKWRNVSRPAKCEVQYQDADGNIKTWNMSGDEARVVQHEMDHLDGILITDKPYDGN